MYPPPHMTHMYPRVGVGVGGCLHCHTPVACLARHEAHVITAAVRIKKGGALDIDPCLFEYAGIVPVAGVSVSLG